MHEYLLQFFKYDHLPAHLQAISKPFSALANMIVRECRSNPERSAALRKLLEAKDWSEKHMDFSDNIILPTMTVHEPESGFVEPMGFVHFTTQAKIKPIKPRKEVKPMTNFLWWVARQFISLSVMGMVGLYGWNCLQAELPKLKELARQNFQEEMKLLGTHLMEEPDGRQDEGEDQ